jgi:hypothetical protein
MLYQAMILKKLDLIYPKWQEMVISLWWTPPILQASRAIRNIGKRFCLTFWINLDTDDFRLYKPNYLETRGTISPVHITKFF